MKQLKVAGLCLVAMLAMGMTTAATATAAGPVWEQCTTEKEGTAPPTRYTEGQCKTVVEKGIWAWKEIPATKPETVQIRGTLILKDTKTPLGESEVGCTGEGAGKAGGSITKIESVEVKSCTPIKGGCEKIEEAKAVDLPWETAFFETEKKILQLLKGTGNGEPGWSVKCHTAIGSETDECKSEEGKPESHLDEPKLTGGNLLELETLQKLRKAKCSQGGAESGVVETSLAFLKGTWIRVR
jgi:hypothetical protein